MFAHNLTTPSTTREGQLEVDSPEVAEREIKALLDKLTMDGFDSISDQIIEWANSAHPSHQAGVRESGG
jgi:translation initiation factor 4G